VEYHPPPKKYDFMMPSACSEEDYIAIQLDASFHWHWRNRDVSIYLDTHPSQMLVVQPVIIHRSRNKELFQLKTAPRYCLRTSDKLECFGMLVGEWELTDKKRRHRTWGGPRRDHQEWVKVRIVNHNTEQMTWLDMPAKYYYPPSLVTRVRSTFQKLGSLFTSPSGAM
jgi:hypothetical protein